MSRMPAITSQRVQIQRRIVASGSVEKEQHYAFTTYRKAVFIDRPEFSRVLKKAVAERCVILVGDVFGYMRNLEPESALRCMAALDTCPVDIINADDGRSWSSYSTVDKQAHYLAVRASSVRHARSIRRNMPKNRPGDSESLAKAQKRAAANISRIADRRALELKNVVTQIGTELGRSPLTATVLARELNRKGIMSARGKEWSLTAAKRLLQRLEKFAK